MDIKLPAAVVIVLILTLVCVDLLQRAPSSSSDDNTSSSTPKSDRYLHAALTQRKRRPDLIEQLFDQQQQQQQSLSDPIVHDPNVAPTQTTSNSNSNSNSNSTVIDAPADATTPCEQLSLPQCLRAADCKFSASAPLKCVRFNELLQTGWSATAQASRYQQFAYKEAPCVVDTMTPDPRPTTTRDGNLDRIARFKINTSWMFDSWFDYDVGVCGDAKQKEQEKKNDDDADADADADRRRKFGLRGYVPPPRYFDSPSSRKRERIDFPYKLENFCLSPTQGIFGYKPRRFKLTTFDETGLQPEAVSYALIRWIKPLANVPDCFFDNVDVVLYPMSSYEANNNNLAHSIVRMTTLDSIIDLVVNNMSSASNDEKTRRRNVLVVYVSLAGRRDSRSAVKGALRLFLHGIGTPWASVTLPHFSRGVPDGDAYSSSSGMALPPDALCFRRGFLWAASAHRARKRLDPLVVPSYAFSWRPPYSARQTAAVEGFKRRLARCYGGKLRRVARRSSSSSDDGDDDSDDGEPIHIVFSRRSRMREIENMTAMATRIVDFAQHQMFTSKKRRRAVKVTFLEPRRVSFADLVKTALDADVMVGLHSATLQTHIWMPRGAVLVHGAQYPFSLWCSDRASLAKCIFGTGALMFAQHHIFLPSPDNFMRRNLDAAELSPRQANIEVPLDVLKLVLARAACLLDTNNDTRKNADNAVYNSNALCPNPMIKRAGVVAATDADLNILESHAAFLAQVFSREDRNPFFRVPLASPSASDVDAAATLAESSLESLTECRRIWARPFHRDMRQAAAAEELSRYRGRRGHGSAGSGGPLMNIVAPNFLSTPKNLRPNCQFAFVLGVYPSSSSSSACLLANPNSKYDFSAASILFWRELIGGYVSYRGRPAVRALGVDCRTGKLTSPVDRLFLERLPQHTRVVEIVIDNFDIDGAISESDFGSGNVSSSMTPSSLGKARRSNKKKILEVWSSTWAFAVLRAVTTPVAPGTRRDVIIFASPKFAAALATYNPRNGKRAYYLAVYTWLANSVVKGVPAAEVRRFFCEAETLRCVVQL